MERVISDVMIFTSPRTFVKGDVTRYNQLPDRFELTMNVTAGHTRCEDGRFPVVEVLRHYDVMADGNGGCQN